MGDRPVAGSLCLAHIAWSASLSSGGRAFSLSGSLPCLSSAGWGGALTGSGRGRVVRPSDGAGPAGVRAHRLLVPSGPCSPVPPLLALSGVSGGTLVARLSCPLSSLPPCGRRVAASLGVCCANATAEVAPTAGLGDLDLSLCTVPACGAGSGGAVPAALSSRARRLISACLMLCCILALCSSVMVPTATGVVAAEVSPGPGPAPFGPTTHSVPTGCAAAAVVPCAARAAVAWVG